MEILENYRRISRVAASAQNFADDFTGTAGASLGNAGDAGIQNNSAEPVVSDVDPNASKIENASDFMIVAEFTADSGGARIWFLGRSDANSNNQAAISGFGVRFFPNTGFLQAMDFDGGTHFSANRREGAPDAATADYPNFRGYTHHDGPKEHEERDSHGIRRSRTFTFRVKAREKRSVSQVCIRQCNAFACLVLFVVQLRNLG